MALISIQKNYLVWKAQHNNTVLIPDKSYYKNNKKQKKKISRIIKNTTNYVIQTNETVLLPLDFSFY